MSVLLIALSFTFADDDAAAKKLFDSVEKKVASAKSLKVEFTADLKEAERGFSIKGKLLIAKGNKLNLTASMKDGDKENKLATISDGKDLALTQRGMTKTDPVPEKYAQNIQKMMGRIGPALTMFTAVSSRSSKRKVRLFESSDYSLGKAEKIGKREAKVLLYKLTRGTQQLQVKVWIDAKTNLPVKRVLRPLGEEAKRGGYIVETSTYTLNPKLDDKTFKLPK